MTATASALAAASTSWVTMTTVVPCSVSRRSQSRTRAAEPRSRAPVGSSAKTIRGRLAMTRAMATRWRSPPESWWGLRPAR